MSLAWLSRLSLTADGHTILPGYSLLLFIFLHPAQEVVTTTGVLDVLNAEIDALLDYPIPAHQMNRRWKQGYCITGANRPITVTPTSE